MTHLRYEEENDWVLRLNEPSPFFTGYSDVGRRFDPALNPNATRVAGCD